MTRTTRDRIERARRLDPGFTAMVERTPMLAADERAELFRRVRLGDPEARDRIIRSHARLVVRIAGQLTRHREHFREEMIGEGFIGLARAVDMFDPGRNRGFVTYATHWIQARIGIALATQAYAVALPARLPWLIGRYRRAAGRLVARTGREPDTDAVAAEAGLSKSEARCARHGLFAMTDMPSIDEPDSRDGNFLRDSFPAQPDGADAPENPLRARLRAAIDDPEVVTPEARIVLILRFGFEGPPLTQEAVARRLHMGKKRVAAIEQQALAKLRDAFGVAD